MYNLNIFIDKSHYTDTTSMRRVAIVILFCKGKNNNTFLFIGYLEFISAAGEGR